MRILPNPLSPISEFSTGLNGDCIETAMAVCLANVRNELLTPQTILYIYNSLKAKRMLDDNNGAMSINNCGAWFSQEGIEVIHQTNFHEPFNGDWLSLLSAHAGINPIVLNVANAQALTDIETGVSDEWGVQYHGLAVVGIDGDVFICVDGDHPQASYRMQHYHKDNITETEPCGMTIIRGRYEEMKQAYTYDTGTELRYEGTNLTSINGFRLALLNQLNVFPLPYMGKPVTPEIQTSDARMNGSNIKGVIQFYIYGILVWEKDTNNIYALQSGDVLLALANNNEDINTLKTAYTTKW